jgi:LPXTG-site transpeptidase (sortase) family protein
MFIHTLKSYFKQRLLIIVIIFSLLFIYDFIPQDINKKALYQSKVSIGLPVRLTIPVININAVIQYVGVTSDGTMEVPTNATDVGWFKLGPKPGEKGSSVIAGHFDNENGGVGVFVNLYKLKKGDKLFVEDNKGKVTTFIVRESRTYNPGYADDVFSESNNTHLNLITCDGLWDGAEKSYSKRLVVFADIIL